MSDGITDATRCTKEAIHRFRDSIRQEVIGSFTVKELVEELSSREFVETYTARLAKIIIVVVK